MKRPRKPKLKKSKVHYMTYSGGCRKVCLDARGKMVEYPYATAKAVRCTQPGRHPHRPSNHTSRFLQR